MNSHVFVYVEGYMQTMMIGSSECGMIIAVSAGFLPAVSKHMVIRADKLSTGVLFFHTRRGNLGLSFEEKKKLAKDGQDLLLKILGIRVRVFTKGTLIQVVSVFFPVDCVLLLRIHRVV